MTPDKQAMLVRGIDLVEEFCELNDLAVPGVKTYTKEEWRFPSTCAYYRENRIHIAPSRCASIGHAARAWSYPGYVTDRTPYGVMAHELGHHVDFLRSSVRGAYGGSFSVGMRLLSKEPKLTSYCPNDWEWFAEMFRLFCTNPLLLELIRPKTHALMLEAGLKPVERRPWPVVLEGAPERTREMARRKVNG